MQTVKASFVRWWRVYPNDAGSEKAAHDGWLEGGRQQEVRDLEKIFELQSRIDTLEALFKKQSIKLAEAFWHDCGVEGERGSNHCQFEGTHICTVCQKADLEARLKDPVYVHAAIMRKEIALTKEQAIHVAGLPADIEARLKEVADIAERNSKERDDVFERIHSIATRKD